MKQSRLALAVCSAVLILILGAPVPAEDSASLTYRHFTVEEIDDRVVFQDDLQGLPVGFRVRAGDQVDRVLHRHDG